MVLDHHVDAVGVGVDDPGSVTVIEIFSCQDQDPDTPEMHQWMTSVTARDKGRWAATQQAGHTGTCEELGGHAP